MMANEGRRALVAVATVLVVAFAFQAAQLPAPALYVLAMVVVALLVYVRLGWHARRVRDGWMFVYNRRIGGRLARVMRRGGVYQSAMYLDEGWAQPVFAYQRAFDVMFAGAAADAASAPVPRRVLALGGGGFAWPKHAVLEHEALTVDVVEIDPAVTDIARRWFGLDVAEKLSGGRLRVITADGRAFLDGCAGAGARVAASRAGTGDAGADADACPPSVSRAESACQTRYDAIVNDTFSGGEPVRALATVEAARAVASRLMPGGLYLMNVVSRDEGRDLSFLRDEVATLSQVFVHVHVLPVDEEHVAGEDNYLLVATDGDVRFDEAVPFDGEFLGTAFHDAA